jgi:hypothetical protein
MTQAERSLVTESLKASEAQLLLLLEPVHDGQWTFREREERWSLAENLEHLILFELFIRKIVAKILTEPARSENLPTVEDAHVLALREVGETKLKTRDIALPKGALGDPDKLQKHFQRERAKTIDFARTVEGDLRAHFFAHLILGELDAYQWLLLIAQHTERHIAQMKAVMSAPNFPQ